MDILPILLKFLPGISPQWRALITESSKALGQYKNTKQDLLRAIAERQLRPDDIRRGMAYLQSGPVASILDTVRPGSTQQLQNLFSSIVNEGTGGQAKAPETTAGKRRGNPFPSLNQ